MESEKHRQGLVGLLQRRNLVTTDTKEVIITAGAIKPFVRPDGHEGCKVSMGIHECLTFGTGKLSDSGFWEYPCWECAREHERQFPECGPCWPHTEAQLEVMGLRKSENAA
jgi:hypothetical protein